MQNLNQVKSMPSYTRRITKCVRSEKKSMEIIARNWKELKKYYWSTHCLKQKLLQLSHATSHSHTAEKKTRIHQKKYTEPLQFFLRSCLSTFFIKRERNNCRRISYREAEPTPKHMVTEPLQWDARTQFCPELMKIKEDR